MLSRILHAQDAAQDIVAGKYLVEAPPVYPVRARDRVPAGGAQSADGVLSIATNFRSCAPIMSYVNERFEAQLSEEKGQPGFQALDPFLPARAAGPSVAALDIAVADENGKASAPQQRDGEAEAVAEMCAQLIGSETIRDILEKLQALRRQMNATTPHALLSQAIDVLRVRPILLHRHRGQAERALANVDLYLGFSRAYAVRGLRAFAEAMTAAWSDETRAVEGRPDAQEEAVALYTMHAAKGLEWPVVVPINTMTQVRAAETAVTDRASGRFYCPVFGVEPSG